ncbi:MAG: 1-acyl-sn-glycerol-3-phosphate acyltransferase [Chitinophagaceae bacterium]|nr:1-acyl-sn-glycerol-3-phosphate acyltransferase [Chitinophagaceae bacterium]
MLRLLWKMYWKITGWHFRGTFPREYKKMVMIVAPHTSWKDILVGFSSRAMLGINDAKFLGKKELFDGPFGWLFKALGGVPVDRFSSQGMVEQVVNMINAHESFLLGMSPEGTRKRVDKLRTGFYHIARNANIPILMVGLDFGKKEMVFGEPFFASTDEEADIKKIISFFAEFEGSNPEGDLRHLKQTIE